MPVDGNAKPHDGGANADVDTSKIGGSGTEASDSQREEGDRVSAESAPRPAPRRFRGRRRIRTRAQVRARLDELAGKLERNAIDPKTAAIMVQALNGVLSCLNAEKDEDFEKRLAAVEQKVSTDKPRKRGGDA